MMGLHLETNRLLIREWQLPQEAELAFAIYGDPIVMQFIRPPDPTVDSTQTWLEQAIAQSHQHYQGRFGLWAIVEKTTQHPIGSIILDYLPDNNQTPSLNCEIGWHLRHSAWGHGYATEAAQKVLNYGFKELHLPCIYAVVRPGNHRSLRVTQRLGMHGLGLTQQYYGTELLLFERHAQPQAPLSHP